MIRYYDSPAAMAREAINSCASTDSMTRHEAYFLGPETSDLESLLAAGGDESDVPEARKLLERFECEFPETDRVCFVPSVAGAYPCVPDFIQGMPESMRAKTIEPNLGAPIKLGIVTTISAGIANEPYRKRSAAIMAILMHLTNTGRAVELYSVAMMQGDDNGETVLITRIPSIPLSLAESNMATGNLAFSRRIPFAIGEKYNGFNGKWPRDFNKDDHGRSYIAKLAKREGFQMILPPLHLDEANAINEDAAAWMISKYEAIQAQIDIGA